MGFPSEVHQFEHGTTRRVTPPLCWRTRCHYSNRHLLSSTLPFFLSSSVFPWQTFVLSMPLQHGVWREVGGQALDCSNDTNLPLPNEVGHRRGASITLFRCPLPKRHGQVSLHVAFQRKHSVIIGNKRGLMHYAATQPMTIQDYSSCHPLPCGRPSRPPWWDVILTTHYDGSVNLPLARFR